MAFLSLRLFDELQGWHQLGLRPRQWLETAALLHDIGWSRTQPDGAGHHKVSATMIREHPWQSLERSEIDRVALIARYHRKSLPRPEKHPEYAALPPSDRVPVRRLAALLRIADGLDRRHVARVRRLRVDCTSDRWTILVASPDEWLAEQNAAEEKADLLRALVQPIKVRFADEPSGRTSATGTVQRKLDRG